MHLGQDDTPIYDPFVYNFYGFLGIAREGWQHGNCLGLSLSWVSFVALDDLDPSPFQGS